MVQIPFYCPSHCLNRAFDSYSLVALYLIANPRGKHPPVYPTRWVFYS